MKTLSEYINEGILDDDFDVAEDKVAWSMLIDLLGTEWNVSKNKSNSISYDYAERKAKELIDHLNRFVPESNFNISNQGKKVASLARKNKDVVLSISVSSVGYVGVMLNSWSGQKYAFQYMKNWNEPSIRCSQWTNGYDITNQTYYFKVPKEIARIIFEQNGTTFKG